MVSFYKYAEKNFCEFLEGDNDIINDSFFNYLETHSNRRTYVISPVESYRIDLITDNIYGNKNLYWILMRLNAILHVEELSEYMEIEYIELADIESAYLAWKAGRK